MITEHAAHQRFAVGHEIQIITQLVQVIHAVVPHEHGECGRGRCEQCTGVGAPFRELLPAPSYNQLYNVSCGVAEHQHVL